MINVFLYPLITPSLRSTVTPGKFPTCCEAPVNWLNNVVFPQFWFPTRANVNVSSSLSGFSVSFLWYFPPSPYPGCAERFTLFRLSFSFSSDFISFTSIFSASSKRIVSSYPCIFNSIGSPIGAYFTTVTSAPRINPISRKCCLSAPLPPTDKIIPFCPMPSSFNVIIFTPHLLVSVN